MLRPAVSRNNIVNRVLESVSSFDVKITLNRDKNVDRNNQFKNSRAPSIIVDSDDNLFRSQKGRKSPFSPKRSQIAPHIDDLLLDIDLAADTQRVFTPL